MADALSFARPTDRDGDADLRSTGAGIVDAAPLAISRALVRSAKPSEAPAARSVPCFVIASNRGNFSLATAPVLVSSDSFSAGWIRSTRSLCVRDFSRVAKVRAVSTLRPTSDFEDFLAMICSRTGT